MKKDKIKPNRKHCSKCKSTNIVPIVYGLPSAELQEKINRGEVASGGCLIYGGEPNWKCKDCTEEFHLKKYDD